MGQLSRYIDSHVHLWTDDLRRYPLASGFTAPDMARNSFLPADILLHARASGVERIVLVQMSYYGSDNSYMLDVIRGQPDMFRGIAVVDRMLDRPSAQIRRLVESGVRGVRIELNKGVSTTSAEGAALDRLFHAAAREELAICPLMVPDALPALRQFCCRHPDSTVVIDHLAGIGDGAPVSDADVNALCSFAVVPNVYAKLSGFYTVGKGPPHLDMLPLIKRVYEAFGPQRLMWGSDAPFQIIGETYEDSIALIRDHLDFASAADREWMLCGTAEKVFFQ